MGIATVTSPMASATPTATGDDGAPAAGDDATTPSGDGGAPSTDGAAPADGAGPDAPAQADGSGAAADGGPSSVLRDHKQLAWWILNITVVLIAAVAISRRSS